MDAAYYREYRRKNKARINAQERARKKAWTKEQRQRKNRAEAERRKRRRAQILALSSTIPSSSYGHELYERVSQYIKSHASPGRFFRFKNELNTEDAYHIAIVALLEGTDPASAVDAYLARERYLDAITAPLFENPLDKTGQDT